MIRFAKLLPALAVALAAAGATAQERTAGPLKVDLDGATATIPAPFGYCDLEADQPRDRALISALERLFMADKVLRRMSPCDELKEWRAGSAGAPPELVQFTWLGQNKLVEADRAKFLRDVAGGNPVGRDEALRRARDAFPAAATESSFATIAVAERDARAVYVIRATAARFAGSQVRLMNVTGTTMIGAAGVSVQVYSPREDGSEAEWMLRDAHEHVDRLVAANGGRSRRFEARRAPVPDRDPARPRVRPPRDPNADFFGRNGGYIALGLVGGGLLLAAIGIVFARRLKPAA
ncbi:MAG: hypothetical protein IPK81_17735 [Rhodospirillales bacterium]|nr:MAG: hypothetical protein IPK81_17735 [Rhodospirillales bacterium]